MRRLGGLWRHRDFVKLWAGETLALFGAQVTALALPLTAVLALDATPTQMGLLQTAKFAPFLLVTLFAGVWVDRARRRPILIAANVGRAALLTLVPAAALSGVLTVEVLYAVVFLVGSLTVFFELAYQSFLPSLVGRWRLVEGNSRLFASASLAEVGGPGLAGLLIGLVSAPFALAADAAASLASALGLSLIRKQEPPPTVAPGRGHIRREMSQGLRATLGDPILRALAGEAAAYNFFSQAFKTLFVLYAVREFALTPAVLGLVFAAGSIGSLLGSLLAGPLSRRSGLGPAILWGMVLACAAPLLIALPRGASAVFLFSLAHFLTGFGTTLSNTLAYSLRQALLPDRLLGRMNASYRFLTYGAIPLGAFLSGALAEDIGLRATLVVGGLGLTTTWLWVAFSPVPRLRRMPYANGDVRAGLWIPLTEPHEHEHQHGWLIHCHAHVHDAHHRHAHKEGTETTEPHAHWHVHRPLTHTHPHYPDIHHRHHHG